MSSGCRQEQPKITGVTQLARPAKFLAPARVSSHDFATDMRKPEISIFRGKNPERWELIKHQHRPCPDLCFSRLAATVIRAQESVFVPA